MRVLVIEDNHSTAQTIELALAKQGIVCDISDLGEDGLEISSLYEYDLIILDLMLPDASGLDILRKLRNEKKKVPVLILSGLGSTEDKIKGLGFGADDYLTKPFNIDELIARVRAIVRRSKGHSDAVVQIADLVVNLDSHTTKIGDSIIHLTYKEQAVLELLALRKGVVVAKEQFLSHLYNGGDEPEFKIIDVFVCKMRKKLYDASGGVNYIETVWGRGYALKHPNEIPENQKKVAE
ncbi:MAG: response regulator transcription factor [Candidatus Jidaibacter sp.]|jgi:two-component system cell cycle response regulator CtrA|nr:response regulator transcription factor [Candidatus Jidaibacter sp.]